MRGLPGARGAKRRLDAMHTLRRDGADVVVLGLPLAGADAVAVCAALKEAPEPPAVLLADASDQAAALAAALPEELPSRRARSRARSTPRSSRSRSTSASSARDAGDERARAASRSPSSSWSCKRRRASEVLELRAAGVCTAIYLRDGDPIFAEGGSLQETLGRQLVRRGAIGQEDYARVVARMTEGVIQHQSLRLGEVLVELGLLSPAEVYDALALQVREKIVACFQWERFAYDLHEALDEPEDLGIYQCPPLEALVLAGRARPLRPRARAGRARARTRSAVPVLRSAGRGARARSSSRRRRSRGCCAPSTARDTRRTQLRRRGLLDPVHAGQVLAALALGCQLSFRKRAALERARASARAAAARRERRPRAAPPRPAPRARPRRASEPRRVPLGAHPARSLRASAPSTRSRSSAAAWGSRRAPARRARSRRASRPRTPSTRACASCARARSPARCASSAARSSSCPTEPEYRLIEAWLEYRSAQDGDARAARRREGARVRRARARGLAHVGARPRRARPARARRGRRRGGRALAPPRAPLRRRRRRGAARAPAPREAHEERSRVPAPASSILRRDGGRGRGPRRVRALALAAGLAAAGVRLSAARRSPRRGAGSRR